MPRHAPALARDFQVIAVDQRGIGLSDKPEKSRYDTGTLANDLVGLMDALGHEQFAVVGVDIGRLIGMGAYHMGAFNPSAYAERFGGNKHRAAEALGIARSTLYRKVRALGLDLSAAAF